MSRKRIRQLVIIGILLLLLALITAAYLNYRQNRTLGVNIQFNQAELLPVPQYLYSFSGTDAERLARPLGVLVYGGRAYVTDGKRGVLDVFTAAGDRVAVWGKGRLVVPLYVARNPKSGDYYVSDRRLRSLVIFGANGAYKGMFDPKLPKQEQFSAEDPWAPIALAFAPDGTLYVTEILKGHRLLIFDPQGKFVRSIGTAGLVNDAKQGEGVFQFPNSVKVLGNEVWVADSNNRRIQVFDRSGEFKRIIVTEGLPRGFDFLPRARKGEPRRLVVVDTLAHDGTIWDAKKAEKVLTFGERGVLEGQFSYPNDVSIDGRRRIFVADTANGRIQVWGWPSEANPIPTPTTPMGWLLCLSPLLLLPLLLLLRKKRYFVTEDFVRALLEAGLVDRMPQRRVRWEILPVEYEALQEISQNGVNLGELLHPAEHSETDARALQERYELEWRDAVVLSIAQRAKLFGTEDQELRRVARVLELPVYTAAEYIEKTNSRQKVDSSSSTDEN